MGGFRLVFCHFLYHCTKTLQLTAPPWTATFHGHHGCQGQANLTAAREARKRVRNPQDQGCLFRRNAPEKTWRKMLKEWSFWGVFEPKREKCILRDGGFGCEALKWRIKMWIWKLRWCNMPQKAPHGSLEMFAVFFVFFQNMQFFIHYNNGPPCALVLLYLYVSLTPIQSLTRRL